MKFFLLIVLLISLNLFAQQTDTTSVDTVKTITDSLFIASKDTLSSDTTKYVPADTLYPLYQNPFYSKSFFVNRETIDKLDYRYAGNLFQPAGFSFLKDRGLIGQPNELMLYGNGNGGTAFFLDGILFNNRHTNFLDLNFIQTELIDSIEILPLPRGFLYGTDNYLTAVNFIEKDFLTPVPYTRIKYYEGTEGEAFVDGIFNASFLNRFNFTFNVTNRKFDGTYTNSDFSLWQAKFRLKYFLSNKINLTGSYYLVNSDIGLNGGVDIDSISKRTNDINNVLYDPLSAPVVYSSLRQQVDWDKFNLRMLGSFNDFNSDINLYYHSTKENYSGVVTNDEIKNFIWGASLKQSYSHSIFNIELNGTFERRELTYNFIDIVTGFQNQKIKYNVFSVSPVFSLYLIDSLIIPSVFFKTTKYSEDSNSQNGYGFDVTVKALKTLGLYFGISKFDFLNGLETDVFEAGASLKSKNIFADLKLYSHRNYYTTGLTSPKVLSEPVLTNVSSSADIMGIGLSVNYDLWKIGLEGSFNYNSFEESSTPIQSEIKTHFNGGIFYKDSLFNQNLDLKTGFVFKYFDFESDAINSALQVDFTIAGIIQKVATVYFSWENLFDQKYFIVPYYPMRERGIRFGLAWELFN